MTPPVDLTLLSELTGADPVKMRVFAERFIESTRQDLQQMQQALQAADLPQLRRLGHHARSPAQMVGALQIRAACCQLEACTSQAQAEAQVAAIMCALGDFECYIKQELT